MRGPPTLIINAVFTSSFLSFKKIKKGPVVVADYGATAGEEGEQPGYSHQSENSSITT